MTEHVAGEGVDTHVRRQGPLQGERLAAFAAATALGIDVIHAAGITHRDITPGNVILSPEGPKIIDLGTALVESATRLTRTGTTVGIPGISVS